MRRKRPHKNTARFPKIEVGFTTGSPFCMCFLFRQQGTEIIVGSWCNILDRTETYPLCHGITHVYGHPCLTFLEMQRILIEKKDLSWQRGKGPTSRIWELFGFNSRYQRGNSSYFHLGHLSRTFKSFTNPQPMEHHEKRNHYHLIKRYLGKVADEVLATWRRLPCQYLRELKKLESL